MARDKRGRFLKGFKPWNTGKKLPKALRENMSIIRKRLFREGRLKVWNKGKRMSLAQRKKLSIARKEYYKRNPDIARNWSKIRKLQYKNNPEIAKKVDKSVTAWWRAHPQARKTSSQKMKQFYLKNPQALAEFLKHGKNPLKPHLKTKQGFIVRSKGEQQIANFLHDKKIPSLYEAISLFITKPPYAGNICTPDFYIPQWNIFIEFYGGYPKAWKKKVLKNKLYPAHKIPVLGITPAELRDLGYYLLRQGEELSETETARRFKIRKWIR